MTVEKPILDTERLKEALNKVVGVSLPPSGKMLAEFEFSEDQLSGILLSLGEYLSRLHAAQLPGFGYLNEDRLNQSGAMEGRYKSWYGFWLEFFDTQVAGLDMVLDEERRTGIVQTPLDAGTREIFDQLVSKRGEVRKIIIGHRALLGSAPPRFLNGNIHPENIYVDGGKFSGLGDYHQMLVGDPVDDLAYFSVMPLGEKYLPFVRQGWETEVPDFEERLHLYRLLESYRKIYTRYVKHHYLADYPEPLKIAEEELRYFGRS